MTNAIDAAAASRATPTVTRYLRWIGTLVLLLAITDFMVQGFQHLGQGYRYWVMHGLGVLFAACGLLCGYYWRDTAGARLFLGLATAATVAQCSQIAALVHERYSTTPLAYGGWWSYEILPIPLIAANLLLSLALLTAIAYLAYSVLARKHAPRLTLTLVLGAVLLILPLRGRWTFAAIALADYAWLSAVDRRHYRADETMRLAEGWAARLIAGLPLLIIIIRQWFYGWGYIELASVLGILATTLLVQLPGQVQLGSWQRYTQMLGAVFAAAAWVVLSDGLFPYGPYVYWLTYLPVAAFLFLMPDLIPGCGAGYRNAGSWMVILVTLASTLGYFSYADALLSIASGTLLGLGGVYYRARLPLILGLANVATGTVYYLKIIVDLYQYSPWLATAALGIAILLLASYLESHAARILIAGRGYLDEVRGWH